MTEYQRKQYFKVPEIYESLFSKITDPFCFSQDKWYRIPEDTNIKDFLNWYYKMWGCIEFSETKTHFRVTFWPILRKPGKPLSADDFKKINGEQVATQQTPINDPILEDTIDGL